MNDVLNPDSMLEATRLTRAGRLAEATTLLQRMLRGETAPDIGIRQPLITLLRPDASRRSLTRMPRPSSRRMVRS